MAACQVENVIDYFRVDILADLLEELNDILSVDPLPTFWEIWRSIEFINEPGLFEVFQEGIFVGWNVWGNDFILYG